MSVSDQSAGNTLLLDAALQSIPYGFCVWSPQLELQMWNKNYLELYGFSEKAIYRGISLEAVAELSARMGNHPGVTADEFLESYKAELLNNRSGARAKTREVLAHGRTIETAHVFSPGLGWVVTHEDV